MTSSPSTLEHAAPLFEQLERLARELAPALRQRLADEWTLAARFEHASIASFNKFSLELLALGAPAELVAASNRAALQEVEHARASFALASAYAGHGIGPGPLPLGAFAAGGVDLASAARAAAIEGCVEETLAAAEAARAEAGAEVPAVRWVLANVAREEAEHAALAYRFVSWACESGGASVREAARRGFREAMGACRAEGRPNEPDGELALESHGRLQPSTRAALRQQVLVELIEPVYRELFGER